MKHIFNAMAQSAFEFFLSTENTRAIVRINFVFEVYTFISLIIVCIVPVCFDKRLIRDFRFMSRQGSGTSFDDTRYSFLLFDYWLNFYNWLKHVVFRHPFCPKVD